ncbi:MAG: histone deacetylase [Phycisphaerae bacterium]|nr:histone deacetylase [Phycisphaerae bacterium]
MTDIGILIDERFRRHATGDGHPESPTRLNVIQEALESTGLLDTCRRFEPNPVSEATLQFVHTHDYLTRLDAACRQCYPYVDAPDSTICPESYDIAKLAAGGVVEAARQVAKGGFKRIFCAVRPPGHHAEANRSMGFCLLNNIALAACVLKDEFKLERLLILDFDVHHCNGTQHTFEADPSVLVISLHGHPNYLYPGTGFEEETGTGPGVGYTMNITFLPGAGDDDYREAFTGRIIPAVARYAPQMILVSAGFDAHADDPLGNLALSDEMYGWMTRMAVEMAERHAQGRLVSVLEGGYNPDVLSRCVPEHVRLLQG